jgi:hypothetical protein
MSARHTAQIREVKSAPSYPTSQHCWFGFCTLQRLYAIATNRCLNARRSARRRPGPGTERAASSSCARLKKNAILLILAAGSFVQKGSAAAQCPRTNEQPKFNANRLKTGTFVYRDIERDRDVGHSEISVEEIPSSGNFRFSNVVTGDFSQRWEAITTSRFDPVSASLSFGEGAGAPAFDLNYHSGRVTGFVADRKGPTAGTKRPVNDSVPDGVVDQRLDWAAVSTVHVKSGGHFEFNVYDPAIGVSHVHVRIGHVESVRVPTGQFKVYPITYEIDKRTGTETYKVFVTKDEPRILVREEFPNGSVTELVSIDSSTTINGR